MENCWKLFFLCFICSFSIVKAQNMSNPEIAKAVGIVEKNLKPDHQSQFFQVKVLNDDSLLVETTSREAVRQLDSLLPNVPKKIQLLPETFDDNKSFGVVNLSVTNHRAAPAQAAEMMTQALMGTMVRILKKLPTGYLLVQTPDNYIAYVETSGIAVMTEKEKDEWEKMSKLIFVQLYGNVYSSPDEKSIPVSDIVAGDMLAIIGKKGKFYEVQYPDRKIGYISKKEAILYSDWVKSNKPTFDNIFTVGQKLMGVPYLWGGTSIKGVDCSGFMRTIFLMNGILLPRDASQQARVGESVDIVENGIVNVEKAKQNLLPGDLLFFGTKREDGTDKVTHVALYIGNGRFLQASGFVKISDFSPSSPDYDAFHMSQFLSAKRVLTHIGDAGITPFK
ncbi:MAG: glycoside hydrolase [Pseudopedobacter saltans]|uniref:Glycoside hydrolase n=1 Tax=Pseudopedobacter saltans TaxID=151895 RepID=A0A2W5H573_9SPHI|nr:MAG: glycoside hydrolase [Pseudopedobacter saltans]